MGRRRQRPPGPGLAGRTAPHDPPAPLGPDSGPDFAGIAAVLLVFALGIGFLAWQDWKGNMGPPLPLSQGGAGPVAFSPDGRTVAGAPIAGDTLALWALP